MTDVLIVEDDGFKLQRLKEVVQNAGVAASVHVADSVQKAVNALSRSYALVLLDMALPSHTARAGASPASSLPSGGVEVLLELAYLKRSDLVVVITQYPEIEIDECLFPTETSLSAFHKAGMTNVREVLRYEPDSQDWVARLTAVLGAI